MKRSLFSPPDEFTLAPMLSLLPVRGSVAKIEPMTASLYARYEKVSKAQQDNGSGERRSGAEATMLKTVLEWLSVKPTKSEGEV